MIASTHPAAPLCQLPGTAGAPAWSACRQPAAGPPTTAVPPARLVQHFVRQLGELQFTTSELTETEELVESKLQQHTPRAAAGVRLRG